MAGCQADVGIEYLWEQFVWSWPWTRRCESCCRPSHLDHISATQWQQDGPFIICITVSRS